MNRPPFHLAITVCDLDEARRFYVERLGCRIGRSAERWLDLDLHGHQVSLHVDEHKQVADAKNPVDGDSVPVPHFGVVLELEQWRALAARLAAADTEFVIPPHVRFEGEVGEQATMFLRDPSGNAIEFKAFADPASELFRS